MCMLSPALGTVLNTDALSHVICKITVGWLLSSLPYR